MTIDEIIHNIETCKGGRMSYEAMASALAGEYRKLHEASCCPPDCGLLTWLERLARALEDSNEMRCEIEGLKKQMNRDCDVKNKIRAYCNEELGKSGRCCDEHLRTIGTLLIVGEILEAQKECGR